MVAFMFNLAIIQLTIFIIYASGANAVTNVVVSPPDEPIPGVLPWLQQLRNYNMIQDERRMQALVTPISVVPIPFYMNCGKVTGTSTDPKTGIIWQPDMYYSNGTSSISNACPKAKELGYNNLFEKDCRVRSGLNMSYAIPVPNGKLYKVTIHFMETFFQLTNSRLFDVSAEGKTKITNLDLVGAFGGIYIPGTRSFLVSVTDGVLNLTVQSRKSKGVFSGIAIEDYKHPNTANTTIRINSGSFTNYTDPLSGHIWLTDQYFNPGGKRHTVCPREINNSLLDNVYCSERFFAGVVGSIGSYTMPVTPGKYQVNLLFAETYFTKINQRIFDIYVQNILVKSKLDIYAASGNRSNTAYTLSTVALVTKNSTSNATNTVTISFANVKENAKISGIEIIPYDDLNDDGYVTPAPVIVNGPISKSPSARPIIAPAQTPVKPPTKTPTKAPTKTPTRKPAIIPTRAPTNRPTTSPTTALEPMVNEYRINCGYDQAYIDALGRTWLPDMFYSGGQSYSKIVSVESTVDDLLFQYERIGDSFAYNIPLPVGTYEITLHFAELEFSMRNQRLFDVLVENTVRTNVDILSFSGGPFFASRLTFFELVEDGVLNIAFSRSSIPTSLPKLNAIEVILDAPHIAHAVATGPYTGTIVDKVSNKAKVSLIGQTSHTHGEGLNLNTFIWKEGNTVLGTSINVDYNFTQGNHTISLTVKDDGNFRDTEVTTVTVRSFGFPAIATLEPNSGILAGNEDLIIRGSGFNYSALLTKVIFGNTTLTGSKISILNSTAIKLKTPLSSIPQTVTVAVTTPLGTSDDVGFDYIGIPIVWGKDKVLEIAVPTVGRFGPDEKLYIGTRTGYIMKITMDDDYTQVLSSISAFVNENKESVMGLAFDPTDTKDDPDVYFTANKFFHKGTLSSSGTTINGRIRRASGPALENVIDIVTGLPVSDLDHGLNALEFGDNGELYFTSGSHTNGGIPGKISSSRLLKENFLSAAVNVAYLSHPDFSGTIRWSSTDDGNMIATGIDNFATGLRNPFGIVLHTNGYLYGTDNGPNEGYGTMSTGCGVNDFIPDQKRDDEVVLLRKGQYYGSPNRKRAAYFNNSIQCVWIPPEANRTSSYMSPLLTHTSSIDGIMEYHSNHFGGQLRYNLMFIRYNALDNIFRVVLSPDGQSVAPSLNGKALKMNIGFTGLDLTQAPNGNLIEISYSNETIFSYRPIEAITDDLIVKTVFPRRGRSSGNNTLHIYGVNFLKNNNTWPTVTVGGVMCPVTEVSATKVDCTLPGGQGTVDIIVTNSASTSLFQRGYRYVSGLPPTNFILPVYN